MANSLIASGTNIALYDTVNPFKQLTAAQGGPGRLHVVEDQVVVARTAFGVAGNYVKLCRFPTNALVKKVEIFSDLKLIDGGTSSTALVLDVGVMFSDSTIDGTPPQYQALVPTTAGIGGGVTTPGTAVAMNVSTYNVLFGSITAVTTTGAMPSNNSEALSKLYGGEVTYNGVIATYGEPLAICQQPLITLFNFRDGQNKQQIKLGMFDIYVMCHTAYNTQPAAGYNIFGRVEFMV